MESLRLLSVLFFIVLVDQCKAESCKVPGDPPFYTDHYVYCSYGCCGFSDMPECCAEPNALSDGTIAGIAIGSIVGLALLMIIIKACVKMHRSQSYRPIRPSQNITVVSTPNPATGQTYPSYQQYQYPTTTVDGRVQSQTTYVHPPPK